MLDDNQRNFLKEHTLAVLATGRPDGSPQVSTIMYDYDGQDIVISIKSFTAKWKNAVRRPQVGLVISDGHKQMIYGKAEAIAEDPLRLQLTRRLFTRVGGRDPGPDDTLKPVLEQQQRTVLRIVPERVYMNA